MENTTDTLSIQIAKAMGEMSPLSVAAINAVSWKLILEDINKNYNADQINTLIQETELLLCGLINTEDYPRELEARMRLHKAEVATLINEIDRLVFKKIQDELERRIASGDKGVPTRVPPKPVISDPRFANLPKTNQEAIARSNWKQKIYNISQKYKINIELTGALEEITAKTLMGDIQASQYESVIKEKLGLPEDKNREMVAELNEKIFKNIKDLMVNSGEVKKGNVPPPPYVTSSKQNVVSSKEESSVQNVVSSKENINISENAYLYKEHGIEIINDGLIPPPDKGAGGLEAKTPPVVSHLLTEAVHLSHFEHKNVQGLATGSPSQSHPLAGEEKMQVEKAKIAFWLLDSEKTDPDINEVIEYKGSSSLEESISKMEEDIKKEGLEYVYKEIELPIVPIISKMEKNGIKIDKNYFDKISQEYHGEQKLIEKEIWDYAGREFNINSPKQLGEVLFDELKLGEVDGKSLGIKMKKTSGGARSTKESELEKLKGLHPIIEKILENRELQKLLGTYIDTIPMLVAEDGRLHAKFLQYGTTTGRFSSNNPNLQNIPTKTERGKKIRNAFIAEEGSVLVSFDYSQVELRIAALMSQDSYFIKTFVEGRDIHTAVARKVFGVGEEDVTSDMRRRAKVINFGILYGMGVTALTANLNTNRKEAQIFYDNYFKQFPTIADYLESIKIFARKNGFTKTLFGRKRYFPAINSPLPFMKAMAERMATNAPIQGTATADIIKIGMKNAERELEKAGIIEEARIVLQVHDELVYEIKKEKLDEATSIIKRAMVNAIPNEFIVNMSPVPLDVSVGVGKNWGELK